MSPDAARTLRMKRARLVEEAADADRCADEFQAEGRGARLVNAWRSRADQLRDHARDIAHQLEQAPR